MLKSKGILSKFQLDFLKFFASLPDQEQFYLTGGTALAEYYLGHRFSYDLDLFTCQTDLVLPFSYQIENASLQAGFEMGVVRRFSSFIEFQVSRGEENLRIDLALDSPFRFAPPELGEAGVLVNDFQDIQTDKLLAFYGRAEPRDAIDLYFLLKKTSFEVLANLASQKDTGFDLYWFSISLNRTAFFPDEMDRWPVKMLMDFDPVALKQSFQELSVKILLSLT